MMRNVFTFLFLSFLGVVLLTQCNRPAPEANQCNAAVGCKKITIKIAGYQDSFQCICKPEATGSAATFSFIYRRQPAMESLTRLWESLVPAGKIPEPEASLVALVVYTPLEIKANAELQQRDISGLLAYYRKEKILFTEAYAVRGDSLSKDRFLSVESGFLSTNDIQDIARLLIPGQSAHSAIAWIDFGKLPEASHPLSVLQQHILQRTQ